MIISFGDSATEDLYHGRNTKRVLRFPTTILPAALRKLDMLASAQALLDLSAPPGNRLEPLKGDRMGFYSIRINDQWRIVFSWEGQNAHKVSIEDYH